MILIVIDRVDLDDQINELRLELKRIQTDLGATILYVTHDQTEAMTMASRIGVIEAGRLGKDLEPHRLFWMEDATPAENRDRRERLEWQIRRVQKRMAELHARLAGPTT